MEVIPKYKDISDLLDKGATVEALERIMELREATLELQEENLDLKVKVKKLEEDLEEKAKLTYEAPFYWMIDGGKKDGPFCQQCHDSDKKNIRLQNYRDGWWNCATCKNNFGTAEAQSKDRVAISGSSYMSRF
ncbi:hypothetical protein [Marinomonas posidonica]|uniref:hypothetical protein n=1 Tax=Marinomonas posidonica TaxID=936476 RepID=UPI003734FB87